jgi:hypothetical protein
VLFNVYFPSHGSDTEGRWSFKLQFHRAFSRRVWPLLAAGRDVVVVGDVNVSRACRSCRLRAVVISVLLRIVGAPTHTHRETCGCDRWARLFGRTARVPPAPPFPPSATDRAIDHCDPAEWMRMAGVPFDSSVFRHWLSELLEGGMVDAFRALHPHRRSAFTCWNASSSARTTNYGTRIDYALVSARLFAACTACEHQTDLQGSDHCPVAVTLAVAPTTGPTSLADAPVVCALALAEGLGTQAKISTFFGSGSRSGTPPPSSLGLGKRGGNDGGGGGGGGGGYGDEDVGGSDTSVDRGGAAGAGGGTSVVNDVVCLVSSDSEGEEQEVAAAAAAGLPLARKRARLAGDAPAGALLPVTLQAAPRPLVSSGGTGSTGMRSATAPKQQQKLSDLFRPYRGDAARVASAAPPPAPRDDNGARSSAGSAADPFVVDMTGDEDCEGDVGPAGDGSRRGQAQAAPVAAAPAGTAAAAAAGWKQLLPGKLEVRVGWVVARGVNGGCFAGGVDRCAPLRFGVRPRGPMGGTPPPPPTPNVCGVHVRGCLARVFAPPPPTSRRCASTRSRAWSGRC